MKPIIIAGLIALIGTIAAGVMATMSLRRNSKTNGDMDKMLDVMKGREQRIDRMLDELSSQGHHLEQMVAEEQRTGRALEQLVDRIDRFMLGKFGGGP